VTDGGDNASRMNFRDLLEKAESSNTVIYTIGIFDRRSGENPQALRRLAKATGGRAYFPESVSEVSDVTEQIAREIRQQYTIGYIPTRQAAEGQYRSIRVIAKATGFGKLYVRTRTGYLIPPERRMSPVPESSSGLGVSSRKAFLGSMDPRPSVGKSEPCVLT